MRVPSLLKGFTPQVARSPDEVDRFFTAYNEQTGFSFLDRSDPFVLLAQRRFDDIALNLGESSGHRNSAIGNGYIKFAMVLSGRGTITSETGTYAARPGQVLIAGPGAYGNAVLPGTKWINVALSLRIGAAHAEAWTLGAPILVVDRARRLGSDLVSLFRLLPDAERAGRLRQATELWSTHLHACAESLLAHEAAATADSRGGSLRQVKLAEDIMRADFATPLSIAGVARKLGITPRALQLAFMLHRGMSPHEHLTLVRADAIRRRLMAPKEGDGVLQVTLDYGVAHAGRFAGLYRRLYGERPSDTLRRSSQA